MKKILFVLSHLGTNSNLFCNMLNNNPRIHFFKTDTVYTHPFDLDGLLYNKHKLNNSAAIWAEELFFNELITSETLYDFCKFIFFVDNPIHVLCELTKNIKDVEYVINYYSFRLRKMIDIAQKTDCVFVYSEELKNKTSKIENYLNLIDNLSIDFKFNKRKENQLINYKDFTRIEKIFEKYYSRLEKLSV